MKNLETRQLAEVATPAFVLENVGALATGSVARIGFNSLMSQGSRDQVGAGLVDGFNSGGLTTTEVGGTPIESITMGSTLEPTQLQLAA